jgi:hypothetical protein
MTDIDINAPIAWKVCGRLPTPKITGIKDATEESSFNTADKAHAYKRVLQSQGWVASVTPVFLGPRNRLEVRKKTQTRAVPKSFNEDWKLA